MCGLLLGISGKRIYEWYRNVLSGFTDHQVQQELHQHDTVDTTLIDKQTKKAKVIPVPILEPENFGPNMALDDKNISHEGYTILSNKETGKIAMMIMSRKCKLVTEAITKVPRKIRDQVLTITKDLAEGYDWVALNCFLKAQRIADKFHVIVLALQALQDVRIRQRQAILTAERVAKEEWKQAGKQMKNFSSEQAKPLSNGESMRELLARSRYLLFKFESQWTESQAQRAKILFELFPEIKEAHSIVCSFRNFYKCKVGNKDSKQKAQASLNKWYSKAQTSKLEEIKNLVSSIHRHEGQILNYFTAGHTNAFAESLNNKIQNFVRSNYGVRDRDFFHFRVKQALS